MKAYLKSLWILLLLFALLWLVWPSDDKAEKNTDALHGLASRHEIPTVGLRAKEGESLREGDFARSPRSQRERHESADSDEVDRILGNDDISIEQAALKLRDIATDPARPIAQRLGALQHGLNLEIDSFAGFAEQADLPAELASHYLHEIINQDGSPVTQIRAYMALMNHPDAEIASLAEEMLAFEVGDEEKESTREKLLADAQSKLAKLASEDGK